MPTTKSLGYYNFIRAMGIFYLNSPKGYSRKIINTQTDKCTSGYFCHSDWSVNQGWGNAKSIVLFPEIRYIFYSFVM